MASGLFGEMWLAPCECLVEMMEFLVWKLLLDLGSSTRQIEGLRVDHHAFKALSRPLLDAMMCFLTSLGKL